MLLVRLTLFAAAVTTGLAAAAEPGMVFVPGGEYLRGRSHKLPDDGLKWFPVLLQDEQPVKRIKVGPFYLDAREVTIGQYAAFIKAKKHRAPYNWPKSEAPAGKEKYPVAGVDWHDAAAYCAWAGGKRLPTEAEWERAARGLAEGQKYPWGEREPTKKDACYDTLGGPCETGKFAANYFGLFDMAGNVWEWTADWYGREYYKTAPEANPRGPEQGQYRVIRGGSWADVAKYLTNSYRSWARPLERSPNIGIRCAAGLNAR